VSLSRVEEVKRSLSFCSGRSFSQKKSSHDMVHLKREFECLNFLMVFEAFTLVREPTI
jgi:hypothetical protein